MYLLTGLIITVCLVLIIDWFNAPNEILSQIMGIFTRGKITRVELKPPFGCSKCMTFWITLIFLLITAPELCWMSLVFAFSTKYILFIIEIIDKMITKLMILAERILK